MRLLPSAGPALAALLLAALGVGDAPASPAASHARVVPGTNGKIAFTSNRDHSGRELYTMNADGTGQTRLTTNTADDFSPRWSPDGTRLAFQTTRDGNREIYTVAADGSAPVNVTNLPASAEFSPSWSPDGSRIVFYSNRTGSNQIYTIAADGTDLRQLTDSPGSNENPTWSPDGSRIAFISDRLVAGNYDIWTMDPNGGELHHLTLTAGYDIHPAWSPDGTKLAFTSERNGPDYDVFVMNADGTNPVDITSNASDTDFEPSWSPDGRKILFSSDRDGDYEIYAMNADGTGVTNLTNKPIAGDFQPDWQTAERSALPTPPAPSPQPTPGPGADPAPGPGPTSRPPAPACPSGVSLWVPGAYRTDFAVGDRELEVDMDVAGIGWRISGEVTAKGLGTLASGSMISTGDGEETLTLPLKASARKRLAGLTEPLSVKLALKASAEGCAPVEGKPVTFSFLDRQPARARSRSVRARASGFRPYQGNASDFEPSGYCSNHANSYGTPEQSALFYRRCDRSSGPARKTTCEEWDKTKSVQLGPIEAFSDCFIFDPEKASYESPTLVRLNGLELVPQSGRIVLNQQGDTLSSTGPVRIFLRAIPGDYPVDANNKFPVISTDRGVRMELPFSRRLSGIPLTSGRTVELPMPPVNTKDLVQAPAPGGKVGFFKSMLLTNVRPAFEFTHDGAYGTGRVSLTVGVTPPLPEKVFGAKLPTGLELGTEVTILATNAGGVDLKGKVGFSGPTTRFARISMGTLELRDASITASTDLSATVRAEVAVRAPGTAQAVLDRSPTVTGTWEFANWGLKGASVQLDGLNKPIPFAAPLPIFLQRLGIGATVDPFSLTGSAGVTFGPSIFFRPVGARLEVASLDASVTAGYRKGDGPIPSELTFGPAVLKLGLFTIAQGRLAITPESTSFSGGFGFPPQVLRLGFLPSLDLEVRGYVTPKAFFGAGTGKVTVFGVPMAVHVRISDKALVSCVGPVGFQAGSAYMWETGEVRVMSRACGMRPAKRRPARARAAQAGPTPLTVAAGLDAKTFEFVGATAPPRIVLVGPGGQRVETPEAPDGGVLDGRFMLAKDPANRATVVTLFKPQAGTWNVELLPGSDPLASIGEAEPAPEPEVDGRVRLGSDGDAKLTFSVEKGEGRRLRYVERVGDQQQELGTSTLAKSSRTFTPLPTTGLHTVVALVDDADGVPQYEVPVTRFRLGRVSEVDPMETCRVRRRGSTIRLTWKREDDDLVRVSALLKLKDGRTTSQSVDIDERTAVFTDVPREQNAVVGCTGVDGRARFSKPVFFQTKGKPITFTGPAPVNNPDAELGFGLIE